MDTLYTLAFVGLVFNLVIAPAITIFMIAEYGAAVIVPPAWPVALGHGPWVKEEYDGPTRRV